MRFATPVENSRKSCQRAFCGTAHGAIALLLLSVAFILPSADCYSQEQQVTIEALPQIDHQRKDFYHAIAQGAMGIEVLWSVEPKTPREGDDFTLTLVVRNAANPQEILNPNLQKLEEFSNRFQFPIGHEAAPVRTSQEVRFEYRLRPRSSGTVEIPALKFIYFRWGAREGKQFQTTYANAVPLTMLPALPKTSSDSIARIEAPEDFFHLAEEQNGPWILGRWVWLLPMLLVPMISFVWIGIWRRLYPDSARLSRLRRGRAFRIALHRIRNSHHSEDIAKVVSDAVKEYLVNRIGISPTAQTPHEISEALIAQGMPLELSSQTKQLFDECDVYRFSPALAQANALLSRAESLITTCEGVVQCG